MKKLVLNVEDLEVQSFATLNSQTRNRGTVKGASQETFDASCASCESNCYCFTQGEDTCNYSCDYSCGFSCFDSDCGNCYTDQGMNSCDWRCEQSIWSRC